MSRRVRLHLIEPHQDFAAGPYVYLHGGGNRYRATIKDVAAATGFAWRTVSRIVSLYQREIEMDMDDLEQEPSEGTARFEATGLAGWEECPIRELLTALQADAKVPLYWVVKWSGSSGRDPVSAAWDKATSARSMLGLLFVVTRKQWWRVEAGDHPITVDTIRRDVPVPPTMEECLAYGQTFSTWQFRAGTTVPVSR